MFLEQKEFTMLKTIVLVRGLPGSGKTTFARKTGTRYFETDIYFMSGGEYKFDSSELGLAHAWCQDKVREVMESGQNVVVSNTFIKRWEMKAYYDMAIEYGYIVKEVVMTGEYQNEHGVPPNVIDRMRNNWEA